MKTKLLALLSILMVLCLSIVISGCISIDSSDQNSTPDVTVTLENFEDATISAELGDEITVESSVTDTEGNFYRLNVAVSTKGGDSITIVDSKFEIETTEGYVVVYSVEVNGKTETKEVTINVTGLNVDAIPETVACNQPITMPTAQFIVNSEIPAEEVEVTRSVSFYGNGIIHGDVYLVEDNTVTFAVPGKFAVKYEVTYNEKTYVAEKVYMVENTVQYAAHIVEDYNCPRTEADTGSYTEWYTEFEGERGVVKVQNDIIWAQATFNAVHSIQSYKDAGYTHIKFRVWFEDNDSAWFDPVIGISGPGIGNDTTKTLTPVVRGAWHDLIFDAEWFYKYWTDDGHHSAAKLMNYSAMPTSNAVIYIAEISMMKFNTTEMQAIPTSGTSVNMLLSAEKAFVQDATTQAALAAEIAKKGAIREVKTEWGNVAISGFNFDNAKAAYEADGSTRYLIVRAYMSEGYASKRVAFGEEKAISATPVKVGEWVEYVIDMKVAYENYTTGWWVLNLVQRGKIDGWNYTYISDIYFSDTNPGNDELKFDEVVTVTAAGGSTVNELTSADSAVIEDATVRAALAAEIAEKGSIFEGIVPWDVMGLKGFNLDLLKTYYYTNGSTRYLTVRMFVPDEYAIGGVQFVEKPISSTTVKTGRWVNYVIDMKQVYDEGAGWGVLRLLSPTKIDGNCIVYVSSMTFSAEAPVDPIVEADYSIKVILVDAEGNQNDVTATLDESLTKGRGEEGTFVDISELANQMLTSNPALAGYALDLESSVLKGKILADGSLELKVVYDAKVAEYSVSASVVWVNGKTQELDLLKGGIASVGATIDLTEEANAILANNNFLAGVEIDMEKSVLSGQVAEDGSLALVVVFAEKKMAATGTSGTTSVVLTSAENAFVQDATTQAALAAEIAKKGSVVEIKTEWGNVGVTNFNIDNAKKRYLADGSTRYLIVRAYMPEGYASKRVAFGEQKAISATPVKVGEWVEYVIDMKVLYEHYDSGWWVLNLVERAKIDGFNYTYISDVYFSDVNPSPDLVLSYPDQVGLVSATGATVTELTSVDSAVIADAAVRAALAAEITEKGSILQINAPTGTVGLKGWNADLAKTYYLIDGSTRYLIVRMFVLEEYAIGGVQFVETVTSHTRVKTGKWIDYVFDMKAVYENGAGWGVLRLNDSTKVDGNCYIYVSSIAFSATEPTPMEYPNELYVGGTAGGSSVTTLTSADSAKLQDEAVKAALAAEIADKGKIYEVTTVYDVVGILGFNYDLAKEFNEKYGITRYMIVRVFIPTNYPASGLIFADNGISHTEVKLGKWVDYVIDMNDLYEKGAGWGVFTLKDAVEVDGSHISYFSSITFSDVDPTPLQYPDEIYVGGTAGGSSVTTLTSAESAQLKDAEVQAALAAEIADKGKIYEVTTVYDVVGILGFKYDLAKQYNADYGTTRYMVVRIFIPKEYTAAGVIFAGKGISETEIVLGQWVDYVIDMTELYEKGPDWQVFTLKDAVEVDGSHITYFSTIYLTDEIPA